MLLVTRADSRRVLSLGLAGLVPAALVTLLLVHQPSIGDRRLYPLLRGSVTLVGLVLALATLLTWATAPNRLSRSSLSGLAWAGVTAVLCIGPFLESTPRARLYALDAGTGRVVWTTTGSATAPVTVDDDLVVTDVAAGSFVGLDPATGRERWRRSVAGADGDPLVSRALAAGAFVPGDGSGPAPAAAAPPAEWGFDVGAITLPGQDVLGVARSAGAIYAYVRTPGATSAAGGTVVKLDASTEDVEWAAALPETVAAPGAAAIAADDSVVAVAGGERVAVLDAVDGRLRWSASVVSLGKSRGYALPGAVQHVTLAGSLVILSATPDR